jgi:hypothetical protein
MTAPGAGPREVQRCLDPRPRCALLTRVFAMQQMKRLFERVRPAGRISRTAKIILGPKMPVIECQLIDYSAGGACIQLEKHCELPNRFDLLYGTSQKRCRIVWKRGLRLGLTF